MTYQWDNKKPTAQMLGRWQPFHDGHYALFKEIEGNYVVADFVCPTREARKLFGADYTIWMDTIEKGRFDDTNQMFVKPINFDFKVNSFDAEELGKKNTHGDN